MAALRRPKRERFAQELALGKTAKEAAEKAEYTGSLKSFAKNASKRARCPDIKRRVAELRAPGVQRAEHGVQVTREWMLEKLYRIANPDLPRSKIKVSDQIAAVRVTAQITGDLAPEKHEVGGPDGGPIEVSDKARARALAGFMARIRAEKIGSVNG